MQMIHDITRQEADGEVRYYGVFTDKVLTNAKTGELTGETMVFRATPDGNVTNWSELACHRCAPTIKAMRAQHKQAAANWGEILPQYHYEM